MIDLEMTPFRQVVPGPDGRGSLAARIPCPSQHEGAQLSLGAVEVAGVGAGHNKKKIPT